ncbi:MAG TPA: glycosyltransferase family 87 protein [Rhizomicrobium sp.]
MESLPPVLKRHWPLAGAAVLFGLYGWALVIATGTGHDGAIGPHFNALGADWVIFLAAARGLFSHDLSHIYDQAWITSATNSQFAHWLSAPLPFPLFPYPPVYLLLVVPFAKLSVGWSLLLSQLAQFAALAWALRKLAPDKSWLFFLVGAFLAPAASNNVVAGSNAVLVAALIVGGMALVSTRPLLAGALLGVLVFKPQYAPLPFLALLAAGEGRALAAAFVSAAVLCLLSAVLFGPSLWLAWFNVYLHPQAVAGMNATDWGHMWDESVSTCVSLLGAPHGLAMAAQILAAVVAAGFTWQAFRSGRSQPLAQRLAILCCAVLLFSPHVSNYDLILLALATLLQVAVMPRDARPLALMLPLLCYLAPIFNPPRVMALGLITPLLLLGLMLMLQRPGPQG